MQYQKIDRPVFHRPAENPILTAQSFEDQLGIRMRSVYNSSASKTPEGRYVMLCRVNQLNHMTLLWPADSEDGINFKLRPEPYKMPDDPLWARISRSVYYDPRITYIDGIYTVLIACEGDQGCRVALFKSQDLESLEFVNYINVPDNRNMVIFPEKSPDGRYMRLERPNTLAQGGKGNIWISHSPDLIHWGDSSEIITNTELYNFGLSGLGPSTVPLRIDEGWLIIFHGVMNNCTTREYSAGAAILDADDPTQVKYLAKHPVLAPEAEYELRGLVDHVCFPCAKILEDDGTLKLYYGGADTVQCVALAKLDDVVHACKHW